jgi:hypothetical protein
VHRQAPAAAESNAGCTSTHPVGSVPEWNSRTLRMLQGVFRPGGDWEKRKLDYEVRIRGRAAQDFFQKRINRLFLTAGLGFIRICLHLACRSLSCFPSPIFDTFVCLAIFPLHYRARTRARSASLVPAVLYLISGLYRKYEVEPRNDPCLHHLSQTDVRCPVLLPWHLTCTYRVYSSCRTRNPRVTAIKTSVSRARRCWVVTLRRCPTKWPSRVRLSDGKLTSW